MKQYACLKCGFIHNTEPVRVREDEDKTSSGRFASRICHHGWRTYRECPECGERHTLKWENDFNHPHEIAYEKSFQKRQEKEQRIKEATKKIEDEYK